MPAWPAGCVSGYTIRPAPLYLSAGLKMGFAASKAATLNGARFLGEDKQIGSLATGEQADLLVVHGDPSAKIEDIERVELVFKDGVGYKSAKLIESVRGMVGLR